MEGRKHRSSVSEGEKYGVRYDRMGVDAAVRSLVLRLGRLWHGSVTVWDDHQAHKPFPDCRGSVSGRPTQIGWAPLIALANQNSGAIRKPSPIKGWNLPFNPIVIV